MSERLTGAALSTVAALFILSTSIPICRAQPAFGPTAKSSDSLQSSDDDLYRRRGYGTGGLTFGLGRQGGTAQAGACADLDFARPRNCGPRGDYGVYGNGLGYGFGL